MSRKIVIQSHVRGSKQFPSKMFLFILLMTLITQIKADSPAICMLCNCSIVKTNKISELPPAEESVQPIRFNYQTEIMEYFTNQTKSDVSDKFLYMNCSAEDNVGGFAHLQWPQLNVLGIYGNFRKSKWRKLEGFPENIKEQLVKLSLSENLIREIAPTDFGGFRKLQMLNLSRNEIDRINTTTFMGLRSLIKLDLSGNRIKDIEGCSFCSMSLMYLNLSGNELVSIHETAFHGLIFLRVLDLSRNKLTYLPSEFNTLMGSLSYLRIGNNALEKVPGFPNSLKYLDVNDNNLTSLELTIVDLQYLDVSNNEISDVESAFNLPGLTVLKASNNSITTLPNYEMPHLEILNVANNFISKIPDVITSQRMPLLQELYLDENPISRIAFPTQQSPFSNLKIVSLSHLRGAQKVQLLSFKGIFLESKYNCSSGSGVLLNISHNEIKSIDENAFKNLPICSIDLSHNRLTTLSQQLLPWVNLSYVNVQENPWHCDCTIQWMLDVLMPHLYRTTPRLLFELRCAAPKRFKDKMFVYWYKRSEEVFCKGPSTIYFDTDHGVVEVWTISMIFCVVLSCIILILFCTILVLLCIKPSKPKTRSKPARKKPRTQYLEIRTTIDEQLKSNSMEVV